jgi:hypothetical protein
MMRTSLTLCLLALSLTLGCSRKSPEAPLAADAPDNSKEKDRLSTAAQLVQADVRRTVTAVYDGDLETVLKFTHPKIIEQMGGQAQAKTTTQSALNQVQAAGMKIESLVFPAAPIFTNGPAHEFVVVPTKLVLSVKGQRLESLNYQFGVRDLPQTNWTYIEGSRITVENVRTLFPDFPSGFEFPKVSRKKL